MPCYQQTTSTYAGLARRTPAGYATEADCLEACKEGACCESTGACSVKPQCQCQGAGQVFKGVGTTCNTVVCGKCGCQSVSPFPSAFNITFSNFTFTLSGSVEGPLIENAPSLLQAYIHGLSPLFLPMAIDVQKLDSATYRRFLCSEYNTEEACNTYPPGFVSREFVTNGFLSTLSMSLACNGQATANVDSRAIGTIGGRSWRINGFAAPGIDCTVFLRFENQVVFTSNGICTLTSQQAQATVASGTFARRFSSSFSYAEYSGAGTVLLEPLFNPLP